MSSPDPRFSLANERTVLAWLRTSLAFVAAGLGAATAAHLLQLTDLLVISGMAAAAMGGALAVGALTRWRAVQRAIDDEERLPPSRLVPLAVTATVAVSVLAVLSVVVQLLT